MLRCTKCSAVLNTCDCDWGATVDARSPEAILTAQVKDLQARVEALELQQRIHIGTIRDLQCGAMNYLAYPYDGERQGLDSAVKASLCIVPLEDAATEQGESDGP